MITPRNFLGLDAFHAQELRGIIDCAKDLKKDQTFSANVLATNSVWNPSIAK